MLLGYTAFSLTFGLEAGICEVGRLWGRLAHLMLRLLFCLSAHLVHEKLKTLLTWKSFFFSFFFLALEPIFAGGSLVRFYRGGEEFNENPMSGKICFERSTDIMHFGKVIGLVQGSQKYETEGAKFVQNFGGGARQNLVWTTVTAPCSRYGSRDTCGPLLGI